MKTTCQPKALISDLLQALALAVKQAHAELYGNRTILFGSYACDDFLAKLDVDYTMLRDEEVKLGQKIWFFGGCASDLTNKFSVFVSFRTYRLIAENYLQDGFTS